MIAAAGWLYLLLAAIAALFQVALALGAPWGARALGGRWQGSLPPLLRLFALFQALVLASMADVVAGRAGLSVASGWPGWLYWPVLGLTLLSVIANLTTPSLPERRLWAPVTLAMLLAAAVVGFA